MEAVVNHPEGAAENRLDVVLVDGFRRHLRLSEVEFRVGVVLLHVIHLLGEHSHALDELVVIQPGV